MRKRIIYDPVKKEIPVSQRTRRHPTLDKLVPSKRNKLNEYVDHYIAFLNNIKIAPDVVKQVLDMAKEGKFYKGRNFDEVNEDKTAFALVKYGKKPTSEGLRIIYSHCDSPCLQLKVKPLKFEWDTGLRDLHLGVELDTFGYGGIYPHQWTGRRVQVCGWSIIDGKRRNIKFDAYIPEISPHTDIREEENTGFTEAHKQESLDLIPGHASMEDILKELKLSGEKDFIRSRLYAVPVIKADKLHKYFITGYGHDNRIGVFASVQALLESNPKYTTIVMGFDKEEVGSRGSGGAKSKFFEKVVNRVLRKKSLESITEALREDLYRKSIAIDADVDVGSTEREIEYVDEKSIAKLGYGMFVSGIDGMMDGDQLSPKLADRIVSVLERRSVILQTIGSPVSADRSNGVATMNEFFVDRGISTINCGVPVGSLHSPEEIVHIGDLYYTIRGYKTIIEDPRYVVKKKRRKKK